MALTVAGFDSSTFDYKIVYETASTTTINTNVTGTSGSLYSVDIDNQSNAGVFVKIHDGASPDISVTNPDMIIHVPTSSNNTKRLEIPGGWPFTILNFWTSTGEEVNNTGAPAGGNVIITLVTS
jgi:hypothetical protein